MSIALKLTSICFLIIVIVAILSLVRKGKISVKYSFVWLLPCLVLIVFVLVPGILIKVTEFLGFQTASNMIFALLIALLIFITISLTVIVSRLKNQIRLLVQELSLLKDKK